jgi:hypothetical protein
MFGLQEEPVLVFGKGKSFAPSPSSRMTLPYAKACREILPEHFTYLLGWRLTWEMPIHQLGNSRFGDASEFPTEDRVVRSLFWPELNYLQLGT